MKCQECGSFQIDQNKEEYVCRNCGLILDDSPVEISKEPSMSNATLPTAGIGNVDGRIVKSSWLLSTREKNLIASKKQIELIASRKNFPKHIIQESYNLFSIAVNQSLNRGKPNILLIYACIHASCYIHGIPISAHELTSNTDINHHKVSKMFRYLKNRLNLKIKPVNIIDYIPRYGSRLYLKQKTISLAYEYMMKLKEKHYIQGKSPMTLVACILYIASEVNNDHRTQREISNATGVVENTLRMRTKEVIKRLNL